MKGSELQEIRERMGMERVTFAHALGYSGDPGNIYKTMKRYEMSDRVPPLLARLVFLLSCFYANTAIELDRDRIPKWPEGC